MFYHSNRKLTNTPCFKEWGRRAIEDDFHHQSWALTRAHTICKHTCASAYAHQVHTHVKTEKDKMKTMLVYLNVLDKMIYRSCYFIILPGKKSYMHMTHFDYTYISIFFCSLLPLVNPSQVLFCFVFLEKCLQGSRAYLL